jgi:hypothetical protein
MGRKVCWDGRCSQAEVVSYCEVSGGIHPLSVPYGALMVGTHHLRFLLPWVPTDRGLTRRDYLVRKLIISLDSSFRLLSLPTSERCPWQVGSMNTMVTWAGFIGFKSRARDARGLPSVHSGGRTPSPHGTTGPYEALMPDKEVLTITCPMTRR